MTKIRVVREDKHGQVEICGYIGRDQVIGFYVGCPYAPGRMHTSTSTILTGDETRIGTLLEVFTEAFAMAKVERRKQKRSRAKKGK